MKFALVGNGFIAPKHIEAIDKVGGELVAVADIDPTKEIKDIRFDKDYRNLLYGVDAVSICTPNDTHTDIILEAAKRDKKIICEKPVTFKLEEFKLMKHIPNLYGMFQLRYLPEIGEMRKISKNAREVVLMVQMKRSKSYKDSWKGDDLRTGGLLINIGCHYFDLLGHLFGYSGFVSRWHGSDSGELQYKNGTLVKWSIELTEELPAYERSLTIDGVRFDLVQKENLHIRAYQDFMWGHGITAEEEEKIIRMIYAISM